MQTYTLIGLLGLALGLAACAALWTEWTKSLEKPRKFLFHGLIALSALLALAGLYQMSALLGRYGEPGQYVMETAGAAGLRSGLLLALLGIAGAVAVAIFTARQSGMGKRGKDSSDLPITHLLIWAVRIYVGLLFLYSGFVKANDYLGFSYKLEEYFDVFAEYLPALKGFFKFWASVSEPLAWFISVFEMALAVAILLGWQMRLTATLTMLMMIFFTFLTGFSAVTGKVTDCGCFGDALKLQPWESFTKDLIYMIMLTPVYLLRKYITAFPSKLIALIVTAATFLAVGVFSWYCHAHLPWIDYVAYKKGVDLNVCTTTPGSDGIIKCKDWDEAFRLGKEYEPLQGNTLLVVMYNMAKAPADALKASGELSRSLYAADSSFQVLGMTATGSDKTKALMAEHRMEYDMSFRDQTMLKTVVRSNPGFVLLKNGVVLGKWHHNDMPTVQEIQALLKP